jgi:hypothetical protein
MNILYYIVFHGNIGINTFSAEAICSQANDANAFLKRSAKFSPNLFAKGKQNNISFFSVIAATYTIKSQSNHITSHHKHSAVQCSAKMKKERVVQYL